MTATPNRMPRERRLLQGWVVVCCLLSLVASFNLTVLTGWFDQVGPSALPCAAFSDLEEPPEDEEMLRPGGRTLDGRRGERKQALPGSGHPGAELYSCGQVPLVSSHPISTASRAGCEHAHRNGLGAPL